jgi:hypothetical protein
MRGSELELIQNITADTPDERGEAVRNARRRAADLIRSLEAMRGRSVVDSQFRLAPVALKNRERLTDVGTTPPLRL